MNKPIENPPGNPKGKEKWGKNTTRQPTERGRNASFSSSYGSHLKGGGLVIPSGSTG